MGLYICKLELELCIEAASDDEARAVFLENVRADAIEAHAANSSALGSHGSTCRPWSREGMSPRYCRELMDEVSHDT